MEPRDRSVSSLAEMQERLQNTTGLVNYSSSDDDEEDGMVKDVVEEEQKLVACINCGNNWKC